MDGHGKHLLVLHREVNEGICGVRIRSLGEEIHVPKRKVLFDETEVTKEERTGLKPNASGEVNGKSVVRRICDGRRIVFNRNGTGGRGGGCAAGRGV